MKKLFRLFCAFAAIASFAVACDEPVPEDTTVTLTASFAPLTRTTIDDELTPAWEKGDLLYATDGAVLVSAAVADADNGKKMASFDFEGLATNYGAEGVSYYALYGGSVSRTDATHFSFGLTNDGSWKAAHAAVGKAANGSVTLKSITSAVSFKTSGRNITSVTLSGLAETDKFPTKVTADVTSTPLVTVESAATLTAAVNKKAGVYYFGFFPVENISGLKVTVNYEGGDVKEILFRETYSFAAGKIVELGNIDEKEDNSKVVLTAGFGPATGGVEATYFDEVRGLLWAKGDLLYASDGTTLASAAVTDADNGQGTATFTYPTLDYDATDYYGIYAGAGTVEQKDATHFTIAMASDGTMGNAHVSLGKAVDNDIRLTTISSAVTFKTAGENITTVTLSGLAETDKFPTKVTVGVGDTAPVTEESAETLTVAVNKKAGLYFFGFFPVENISGIKVTVNYEGGDVKEILLKDVHSFAAGSILELGNIDEQPDNSKVVLTAGFGANGAIGAEGTFYTEDLTLAWATGDLLYASDGTTLASAAVEDADNGKSTATFTYTGLDYDATDYYGIYAGAGTVEQKDATHFTIAMAPDGTWGNAQVAFGKAAENDIRLSTLSTGVAFTIAGTDIASVTLSGLIEDDEFPTKATLNTADKTFVNEDAVTSMTANVGGKAGTYYLGFFPVEGISGLKLTANYGAGEPKSVIFKEAFNFKTGDVLDLGKLDPLFGKTFCTVEQKDFTAVSGTIEGGFKYTSYKGYSSTNPAIYNNAIRLYQAPSGNDTGGYIVIESNGDMMTEVHLDIANSTTYLYSVGDAEITEAAANVTAAAGITISDIETDRVVVYCADKSSDKRLNIKAIRIKYLEDGRTVQTLSFPEASYTALMGTPFEAPVLSGAHTALTYTSSNTAVATVDASTGAVTLMGAGTTTISVKAAADDTYKPGRASYDLTVADPVQGVAGIKRAIDNSTSTPFAATLSGAVVTLVQDAYPYTVYIQQGNDAMYLYNAFGNAASKLKVGDRIDGLVTGAGIRFNPATLEVTAFDYSNATVTPDQEVPTVFTTVKALKEAFARYEYCRVKVEDVLVTDELTTSDQDGAIAQGEDTVILRAQVKNAIAIEKGTTIDLVAWPTYYYNKNTSTTTNQLGVWAQSDITAKGGEGRIEMQSTKVMTVGEHWTIGATCNSGATVSYASDDSGVASVDPATGEVTAIAAGKATITASAPAANNFTAAEATCVITVNAAGQVSYFKKVTSNEGLKAGTYLIVYEKGPYAFDGSLAKLDAVNDYVSVTINDSKIEATDAMRQASFTFTVSDGVWAIQSKSGYYIGQTSDANGLQSSTSTQYKNTVSIDGSGNADIISSSAHLRFNSASNQLRFRYYKAASYSAQQVIALYLLDE
ncbi:MAG: Ig-like domain-containing protein [Bacteroidales bacterium]|nr:Ig-like domain-containing protein [Bacteroidales bacterium]